ncbi:MAG: aldose 1-epimerase family protein [Anaerolineae bacterium]
MPQLYGRTYAPEELRQLTGHLSQIAGIRLVEMADGKPRGMRVAEVTTGSGWQFDVHLDRALDIGAASYAGKPVAWIHPAMGAPWHYDPYGYNWGRTFGGGLVTTCGLTFFGQPEQDGAETLGLHGRISHTSAEKVCVREAWEGDDYVLTIEGQARQSAQSAENLLLIRRISTRLGANHLVIEDTVRNDGYRPSPHMILYHCNFGFPVVSPDSELLINDETVLPRDESVAAALAYHKTFEAPVGDYAQGVFFHKPRVDADGFSQAAIVNRPLGFGAYVRWRAAELPCMGQWKQLSASDYVCALEPANYWETPRHKLRAEGRLRFLQPGEEVRYHVELGALADAAAIQAFENSL